MGKLNSYGNFIKIEHTLFSFPIVLAGSFLAAGGMPPINLLVLILIAAAGARTCAMGLNRLIDRGIDSANPRTSDRELPSGKIKLREAYLITGFGLGLYFASCYLICSLVFYLSPIPLLIFIIYPYLKRITPFCHFGVGLALAIAPLGGWLAVTCSFENMAPAVLLALFTLFWVSGFDIIYAILDEVSDLKNKVYSMVSVYGRTRALKVSAICHIISFLWVVIFYFLVFRSFISGLVLLIIGGLLYLEHKKSSNIDLAFFKINILVGGSIFLFIICGIYFK
jgi:4-hydroxybenzoate polyprenyltransferase